MASFFGQVKILEVALLHSLISFCIDHWLYLHVVACHGAIPYEGKSWSTVAGIKRDPGHVTKLLDRLDRLSRLSPNIPHGYHAITAELLSFQPMERPKLSVARLELDFVYADEIERNPSDNISLGFDLSDDDDGDGDGGSGGYGDVSL